MGRHGGPGALGPHVDPAAAPRPRRRRGAGRGRQRRGAAGPRPGRAAAARRAARGRQPRQRRPRPRRLPRPGPRRGAAARPARRARRRRRTPPRPAAARPREGAEQGRGARAAHLARAGPRARSSSPASSTGSTGPRSVRARALAQLLVDARDEMLAGGASAEELLWTLWSRTGWPARLRRSVDLGGGAARRAHRDLDSVCALFEVAARAEEQRDHVGVRAFLATLVQQQIPADTLAERGARGAAVRLLTAHRVQGPRVAAGRRRPRPAGGLARPAPPLDAAPGRPDRRARRRAAGVDARAADGGAPAVLRRLHPRAAAAGRHRGRVRRGRRRAAVPVPRRARRHRRAGRRPAAAAAVAWPAWSPSCAVPSPTPTTTEPLRDAAARRLARLAGESVGTGRWCRAPTRRPGGAPAPPRRSVQPVRDPDQPVPVSASVLESLLVCPTQWFLEREAGGVARAHQSANLGELLHALAQRVATGERRARRRRPAWSTSTRSGTGSTSARRGRRPASTSGSGPRSAGSCTGTSPTRAGCSTPSRAFSTVVELDDGEQVKLTGYADRLELDADGNVVVVDLKTGRTKPEQQGGREPRPARPLPVRRRPRRRRRARRPSARAGGAELVQLGLHRRRRPTRSCSPRTSSPRTAPTATLLRQRLGAHRRRCCAPRRSRPSPASTAATAASSRSARSRAPGR